MKIITTVILSATMMFANVEINSASAKDFESLKGIGVKKAQEIIKYRDTIKCFKSIDELTDVKGIGKATLKKNIKELTLGKCNNKSATRVENNSSVKIDTTNKK